MDIDDIILFYSSVSRVCDSCINFIKTNNIPAKLVRIDSKKTREIVQKGKYFQIQIVPTLLVTYNDGNLQLFVGAEKIILWLTKLIEPRPQEEEEELDYDDYVPQKKKKKVSFNDKQTKKAPLTGLYGKSKKPPVHFDSESDDDDYIESSSDEDIEFLRDNQQPPPLNTGPIRSGLQVGPHASGNANTGMSDLIKIAKQMEQDRKNSLGYKEENLPRFSN